MKYRKCKLCLTLFNLSCTDVHMIISFILLKIIIYYCRHNHWIEQGLLEVIAPPTGFYPNLENLKETFGDSKERVK